MLKMLPPKLFHPGQTPHPMCATASTGLQHLITIGLIFSTKYVIELKNLAQFIFIRSILYGVRENGKSSFSVAVFVV